MSSNRTMYNIYLIRGYKTYGLVYIPHINTSKVEEILANITREVIVDNRVDFCGKIGETEYINDKNKCVYKNILNTSVFMNILKYTKEANDSVYNKSAK